MQIEQKMVPLQVKAVNIEDSTFEGFSAGIGNLDDGNDRIMEGAFAKTIRERVRAGKVKFLDHHLAKNPIRQSTEGLWGTVLEAEEHKLTPKERKELAARAGKATKDAPTHAILSLTKVSKAQPAQDALVKISEGILDALSIGYIPTADKVKYVPFKVEKKRGGKADEDEEDDPRLLWLLGRAERQLYEVAWWEHSAVIWGQNPFALTLPGTVKELREFAEQAAERGLGEDEAADVREVIQALQALAPGCPTRGAIEAVLPKVERLARTLEEMADWEAVRRLEALADDYLADAEGVDPQPVRAFVSWAGECCGAGSEQAPEPEVEPTEEPEQLDVPDGDVTGIASAAIELIGEIRSSLTAGQEAAEEPPAEGRPGTVPTEEELKDALALIDLAALG
jgi:hypothetical protein